MGQSRSVVARLRSHSASGANPKTSLARAIAEFGWPAFDTEILEQCEPAQLNEAEARWMRYHKCREPVGFNAKAGGDANPSATRSPKGQGITGNARAARSRAARAAAGGKQIAVMLTPEAVAAMAEWTAAGYSMAQAVDVVLMRSDPENNLP